MKYNEYRRKTRSVKAGLVRIGGTAPISVQSMTNTDTHDVESTYQQVLALESAGCDIVRITAPDIEHGGEVRSVIAYYKYWRKLDD